MRALPAMPLKCRTHVSLWPLHPLAPLWDAVLFTEATAASLAYMLSDAAVQTTADTECNEPWLLGSPLQLQKHALTLPTDTSTVAFAAGAGGTFRRRGVFAAATKAFARGKEAFARRGNTRVGRAGTCIHEGWPVQDKDFILLLHDVVTIWMTTGSKVRHQTAEYKGMSEAEELEDVRNLQRLQPL